MSNFKISEDLYTGKQELTLLQQFLGQDGFRRLFKRFINTYGVSLDNEFATALSVVPGTNPGFVSIKAGALVDVGAEVGIINNDLVNAFKIPAGITSYIYAKRIIINSELGTVSIDSLGNVIGIGTSFTKVLRGQPGNSTKVRFINSNFNILDYEVLNVVSDTEMVVQAPTFTAEVDLTYGVVGTFSPGVVVDPDNKMIYEYDSIAFSVSTNPALGAPWYILASVLFDGTNFAITDLREQNKLTLLLDPSIRQNGTIALLNKINIFTKSQSWAQGSQTAVIGKQIALPGDGNSYVVGMQDTELRYIQDQPLGTIISLAFLDNNVGQVGSQTLISKLLMRDAVSALTPDGYKPIKCLVDNIAVVPFDTLIFQRLTISHSASPTGVFDGWVMLSNSEAYPLALDAENKVNTLINAAWTDYQFVSSDIKTGKLSGNANVSVGSGWMKYKVLAKILTGNIYLRCTIGSGVSTNILSVKLPNNLALTDTMTFGQRSSGVCIINGTDVVPVEIISQRGASYNSYLNIQTRDRQLVYGQSVEISFSFSFEVGASTYVPPANLPPIANDLSMVVAKNSYINSIDFISGATGNTDPDGTLTNLNVVIITQPTKGNIDRNILATDSAGNPTSVDFQYVPSFGQVGSDSFTYQLVDDQGSVSAIKTYNVNIQVSVSSFYSVVAPQTAGSTAVCFPVGTAYPNIPMYTNEDGITIGNTVYYDSLLTRTIPNSYFKIGTSWYLTNAGGVISSSGSCVTAGNFILSAAYDAQFTILGGTAEVPVFSLPTPINGNVSANFNSTIPAQSLSVGISRPATTVKLDLVVDGVVKDTVTGINAAGDYHLVLSAPVLVGSVIQIQINT